MKERQTDTKKRKRERGVRLILKDCFCFVFVFAFVNFFFGLFKSCLVFWERQTVAGKSKQEREREIGIY